MLDILKTWALQQSSGWWCFCNKINISFTSNYETNKFLQLLLKMNFRKENPCGEITKFLTPSSVSQLSSMPSPDCPCPAGTAVVTTTTVDVTANQKKSPSPRQVLWCLRFAHNKLFVSEFVYVCMWGKSMPVGGGVHLGCVTVCWPVYRDGMWHLCPLPVYVLCFISTLMKDLRGLACLYVVQENLNVDKYIYSMR